MRIPARTIALVFVLPIAACAGILGLRTKDSPRPFPHRAHVIEGQISCATCHVGIERAGDTGPLHLPAKSSCTQAGCHDKPHTKQTCQDCHTLPYTAEVRMEARNHLRFSHKSHVPRLYGNCMRCHTEVARGGVQIYARLGVCLGCHQHEEQYRVRNCDACHVDLQSEGTLPQSHLVHDGDWLREHGVRANAQADLCRSCHQEQFCATCHGVTTPALPSRLAFDEPDRQTMHRAGFRSRHADEARAEPGTCTACHDTSMCRDCHTENGVVAASNNPSPHPPGWVGLPGQSANEHGRAARRDPLTCASCHGGAGEALCVTCHRVGGVGGNPHPPGWSSRRDEQTDMPCVLCHRGALTTGAGLLSAPGRE